MAKAREIKGRIRSISSTQKITRTMEMVSTSKLKKSQDRLIDARPYHQSLKDLNVELTGSLKSLQAHPLMKAYETVDSAILLLITSNRGLCGAFNNNLIRLARGTIDSYREKGIEPRLFISGKKGISYFRYMNYPIEEAFTNFPDIPEFELLKPLTQKLIEEFISGRSQEIQIVFSTFHSAMTQKPVLEKLLPLEGEEEKESDQERYIIEPSAYEILNRLLPVYVSNMIYQAFLETSTSEHGARRTAMKSATENAEDMIKTLTRYYNRARQAQITQELSEIVGGAEALK
jgi:F-type H+-transporting ATPase subunit gamma